MDWSLISIAGIGLLLAGVIKGATGLGYASCALPLLVLSIGLRPAMAIVLVPAIATNVAVAVTTGHFSELVRRFAPLYLAMVPGLGLGLGILLWIGSSSVAASVLGGVIIGYAVLSLWGPRMVLSPQSARLLQIPTGFANGVLTGLTGSQVMPLFPYMMALDLDPNRLVQAINLAVLFASILLACGLLATSIMTSPLLMASVVAIIPALLGVEIGRRLRPLIPPDKFRTCVLAILLIMGLLLMNR